MKIGDKVRFLSEKGGGRIAGFQSNNIVLVEDEDGFEIPVSIREVVAVDNDNYEKKTTHAAATTTSSAKTVRHEEKEKEDDPSEREVTFRAPAFERKGGDVLSAYLAFVPVDIKEITQTRFEAFLVNDSNYYLSFSYMTVENNVATLRFQGEIEPNTKLFVEEFGREVLNDISHIEIQLMAYKRDKSFLPKTPVAVRMRIDTVKFYKLHLFRENDFFETPALLYTIIENDRTEKEMAVNAEQLKKEMMTPKKEAGKEQDSYVKRYENKKGRPFESKKNQEDIVVVDLHAHELLETTAGMNASDILNHQLETMRKTLEQYRNKKGQKIVFIHGKGEGVLRRAIVHELSYRYKSYNYQDASFQEYGYGATQVTIR